MLFTSLTFLALLGVAIFVAASQFDWRARKTALLLLSYAFYAAWNPAFVVLLWISTAVDYLAARAMPGAALRRRRALLICSLGTNLGILFAFKYSGFLVESAQALGAFPTWTPPAFLLPIGISFYTFQTLSYTIDTYRGRAPCTDPLDFALFVTFFPQLVAGPIVRPSELLPQLATPPSSRLADRLHTGLPLFIIGWFEKSLADTFLAPVVEVVFDNASAVSTLDAWTGALAFTAQIFCDFSGYSLMAIGCAAMLGMNLPNNFRLPYAARGFSDFWRRWHITLSSWLRDYLYITLGGNRHGAARLYLALALTMLLGGLWHGAAWTFVAWGALHGTYLVVERLLRRVTSWRPPAWVSMNITLLFVVIAWVFFRAPNFDRAFSIFQSLVGMDAAPVVEDSARYLALGITLALVAGHQLLGARDLRRDLARVPPVVSGVLCALLVLLTLWFGGEDRAFIYFQF